jgi:hypothetical protein
MRESISWLKVGAALPILTFVPTMFLIGASVWTILLYISAGILYALMWLLPFMLRRHKFSVLNAEPLRFLVERFTVGAKLAVPTYVTVARYKDVFDPDEPTFRKIVPGPIIMLAPTESEGVVPEYVDLRTIPCEEWNSVLVATAALPLGLVPTSTWRGQEWVDGGMADNLPVFPIANNEKCDCLIVIRLRPSKGKPDFVCDHWRKIDRLLRVAQLDPKEARQSYFAECDRQGKRFWLLPRFRPPKVVPFREPEGFPQKVIIIAPSRPFGGFIQGTLNFSRRKAEKLSMLGYGDALQALEDLVQSK